jgi:hypothetical protein
VTTARDADVSLNCLLSRPVFDLINMRELAICECSIINDFYVAAGIHVGIVGEFTAVVAAGGEIEAADMRY